MPTRLGSVANFLEKGNFDGFFSDGVDLATFF
jgi:hypothetical protein